MPEYQQETGLKVYRYPSRGMASQLVGFSNSWLLKDLFPPKMVSSIAGCFVPVMDWLVPGMDMYGWFGWIWPAKNGIDSEKNHGIMEISHGISTSKLGFQVPNATPRPAGIPPEAVVSNASVWDTEHLLPERAPGMVIKEISEGEGPTSLGSSKIPSGKLWHSYWKWPFIVDLPIENGGLMGFNGIYPLVNCYIA